MDGARRQGKSKNAAYRDRVPEADAWIRRQWWRRRWRVDRLGAVRAARARVKRRVVDLRAELAGVAVGDLEGAGGVLRAGRHGVLERSERAVVVDVDPAGVAVAAARVGNICGGAA